MRSASLLVASVILSSTVACDAGRSPDSDPLAPAFSRQIVSWGTAVKLDPLGTSLLNTAALEGCPNESPDGRTLFFASDRAGNLDIWASTRDARGTWGTPEKLPAPVNSPVNDFCPTSLPGGGLLFVSTRTDLPHCGSGTADIFESGPDGSGGWSAPVHLGCVINSAGNEFSPSYAPAGGGMLFFSSDRSGKHAIYVSHRGPDGNWGVPTAVAELNLAGYNSVRPNVSADGRDIVFDSDRLNGSGGFDIWMSRRDTPHGTWSEPVNAGTGINSGAGETRASLSRDGQRLYFGSTRAGSSDIYVSHRQ